MGAGFCPYCGMPLELPELIYCPVCGDITEVDDSREEE